MNIRVCILTAFSLLALSFANPNSSLAQTSSPSASLETITQNVKKRLQAIAQIRGTQLEIPQLSVYTGILLDRSNNILTIRNHNQNLLASTSATTRMVRVPGTTRINLDDLVLEENIATIGRINDDRVMVADQVIVQTKPPANSLHRTLVGSLITYDPKKYVATVQPKLSQQPVIIDVTSKTKLFTLEPDSTRTPVARNVAISTPSKLLVIYSPPALGDDITASEILISPL